MNFSQEGQNQALQLMWQNFLEKVFMKQSDDNPCDMKNLEDCRHKLESMFEEKYKPDRDFIDYLAVKKGRSFEDYMIRPDRREPTYKEDFSGKKKKSAAHDDQDMPMDLDDEH